MEEQVHYLVLLLLKFDGTMIKEIDIIRVEHDCRSLTMQYDLFNKKYRYIYYDELTNDFVQYTSLIVVMGFLYFLLRFFKVKIVDIARYN